MPAFKSPSLASATLEPHFTDHLMTFADNLLRLPAVAHIKELQLLDANGQITATIPNIPGKSGSVAVYHALHSKHGCINIAAAHEGLKLFAEHTAHAQAQPGSHPNIDRLQDVLTTGQGYEVKVITC